SQAKLKTIDAGGGAVQTLADATDPRGGAWGADGTLLYAPNPGTAMLRIPAAGGSATPAIPQVKANLGLISERWPSFLPDGKHFIFFEFSGGEQGGRRGNIWLGALDSSQPVKLVGADAGGQYAGGHLLFIAGGNLMSQRFDEKKLKVVGDAVPVAEQVYGDARGAAAFSASQEGKLIFAGGQSTNLDLAFMIAGARRATSLTAASSRWLTSLPIGKNARWP